MDSLVTKLRAHQQKPVEDLLEILSKYQSAVDWSDTGTGKTYVAASVAVALQLPCLVICPKIVASAWHRAFKHFGDTVSVENYEKLRLGNNTFGHWEYQDKVKHGRQNYFVCQSCQERVDIEHPGQCRAHPRGIHCVESKKKRSRHGRFNFNPEVKLLIFDEIHRCGAIDSLNAEMLIAAKRQGIKVLGLSATPATSPLNMRALGFLLDLHGDKCDRFSPYASQCIRPVGKSHEGYANRLVLPNFYRWVAQHGCRKIPPLPGVRWAVGEDKQRQIMQSIRDSILPARGVRVTTESIPDFAERSITAELYDIDSPEKIDVNYREMATALAALAGKADLDKAPEHPLTQILRARQRIELLKIPATTELAEDYIEKGHSIAVFLNFRGSLDEFIRRFPGAATIYGGQQENERQMGIDSFQSNASRLMLIMSDAGGVGLSLPDLDGQHPRGGLVMPGHSAVSMRQIMGRFHRADSLSNCWYRVILAAGTLEEKMYRNLNQKFSNLDSLTDGDMLPA